MSEVNLTALLTPREVIQWAMLEVRSWEIMERRYEEDDLYDTDPAEDEEEGRLRRKSHKLMCSQEKQLVHAQRMDILMAALKRLDGPDD